MDATYYIEEDAEGRETFSGWTGDDLWRDFGIGLIGQFIEDGHGKLLGLLGAQAVEDFEDGLDAGLAIGL